MNTKINLIVFLMALSFVSSAFAIAEVKKKYYASGELMLEMNFKDGKQDGITRDYYPSGKLRAEINFKAGKLDGITKQYDKNGNLRAEIMFKDGKQEGITKVYYENGALQFLDTFKNGAIINRKTYDHEGNLKYSEAFPYNAE